MVGKLTDLGNRRVLNEDYVDFYETKEYGIYAIADGMGGHNAGEVASKMTVNGVISFIKENYNNIDDREILKKAVESINETVYKYSLTEKELQGMGTTLTACYMTRDKIIISNVGDSSCLGVKSNNIVKITKDHSLVQELKDLGSITEEQAKNHPKKNIITRAIGTVRNVKVDIYDLNKDEYDFLILATDGLTNDVSIEEILNIVNGASDYNEACNLLVNLAKERGGNDNISVLIFRGEI